jgi:hypothetical protein
MAMTFRSVSYLELAFSKYGLYDLHEISVTQRAQ